MRNFRNYGVYKDAMDFVAAVYQITKRFPNDEKYGLECNE